MPESCQHPYHQQIKNRAKFPSSAASQRNIDIPAEPLPQCHMPSAVKIPDPPGHIRSAEISGQFDSQHPAKPHCHQRISREIKIDLHGISNGCQPCQRCRDAFKSGHLHRATRFYPVVAVALWQPVPRRTASCRPPVPA